MRRAPETVARRRRRRQEGGDVQIARWSNLAGEANPFSRVDPFENFPLFRGSNGDRLQTRVDPNPTGRAAPAAAAHGGVRNVRSAAHLQNGEADGHRNDAAAGVGHAYRSATQLER
jgi:hypothetical protein